MDRKYTRHLICALAGMGGLPFGLFFEVLPVFMRQANLSLTVIGLSSLTQLPWILNPLWAPWVDRTGTLARWLRLSTLGLTLACVGMASLEVEPHVPTMAALLLLLCASAATQDQVANATFVGITHAQRCSLSELNQLNAWRMAAYKTAVFGGSGLILSCGGALGWPSTFTGCAVSLGLGGMALARVLPADVGRAVRAPVGEPSNEGFVAGMRAWALAPDMPRTLGFVFCYKLALCSLNTVGKPFWLDHGASALQLGAIGGILGLVGAMAGIGAANASLAKLPIKRTLLLGSALQSLTPALYLWAKLSGWIGLLAPTVLLDGMAQGMTTTLLLTLSAQICEPRRAATQSAVLGAAFGLTRVVGGALGGFLATRCGWVGFFALTPLLCLPALLLLPATLRRLRATSR